MNDWRGEWQPRREKYCLSVRIENMKIHYRCLHVNAWIKTLIFYVPISSSQFSTRNAENRAEMTSMSSWRRCERHFPFERFPFRLQLSLRLFFFFFPPQTLTHTPATFVCSLHRKKGKEKKKLPKYRWSRFSSRFMFHWVAGWMMRKISRWENRITHLSTSSWSQNPLGGLLHSRSSLFRIARLGPEVYGQNPTDKMIKSDEKNAAQNVMLCHRRRGAKKRNVDICVNAEHIKLRENGTREYWSSL